MTAEDSCEDGVRRAFGRLRSDAHEVDTMAALGEHDPRPARGWNPRVLVGAAAAIIVAVAVVVGIAVWGDDDDADVVAGGDDSGDDVGVAGDGLLAEVTGLTWELESGSGPDGPLELRDTHPVTLMFESGQVSGTAACNSYFGDVTLTDGSITVGGLARTEMACMPLEVMELEQAYLDALAAVERAVLVGGRLVLTGPLVELEFGAREPVPVAELVGTNWLLDTLIEGEVATSVMGEPAMLRLGDDRTFTGGTGCRSFTGRYETEPAGLQITALEAEGECSADLAAQDAHVVSVLDGAVDVEIDGQRLTLTAVGGDGLSYTVSDGDPAPATYSLDDGAVTTFSYDDAGLSL